MPIRRFRVSIAGLSAVIALTGVTLAALVTPSTLWGNTFYSLMLAALVLAIPRAIFARGERQAFAIGFALCGWIYTLAHYGPVPLSNANEHLLSRPIADILYPYCLPSNARPAQPNLLVANTGPFAVNGGQYIVNGQTLITTPTPTPAVLATPPTTIPSPWEMWTLADRNMQYMQGAPRYFRRIVTNVLCLAFSLAGGNLARFTYRTRDQPSIVPG